MAKTSSPVMASEKKSKTPDKYEIDNAMRTLLDAEEIKQNPHMMKHVSKHIKKKKKAIESIDDLRKKAEKMHAKDSGAYDGEESDEHE